MRVSPHHTGAGQRLGRTLLAAALGVGLSLTPAAAADHCWGPFTASGTGILPAAGSERLSPFAGPYSAHLTITGTASVNIDGRLKSETFVTLATATGTSLVALPLMLTDARINVTACTACTVSATLCGTGSP